MPSLLSHFSPNPSFANRRWMVGAGLVAGMLSLSNQGAMPVALARTRGANLPGTPEAWTLAFNEAAFEDLWGMTLAQVGRSTPPPKGAKDRSLRKQALGFAHGKLGSMVVLRDSGSGTCTPRQVFEFTGRQLVAFIQVSGLPPGLRRFDTFNLTSGEGQSADTLNHLDSIAQEAAYLGQQAFPWAWAVRT